MPSSLSRTPTLMSADGIPMHLLRYKDGGGKSLATSNVSARVSVGTEIVTLYNSSSAVLYGRAGDSTVTASAANGGHSFQIPPGCGGTIPLRPNETSIAVVLASGTGTLLVAERE